MFVIVGVVVAFAAVVVFVVVDLQASWCQCGPPHH